jgi:hypothetical protein
MSTVEKFERDCAYCRQPMRLKWKKGLILPQGVCLVADQVFHDECWDKYRAKDCRKRTRGRAMQNRRSLPPVHFTATSRMPLSLPFQPGQKAAPVRGCEGTDAEVGSRSA